MADVILTGGLLGLFEKRALTWNPECGAPVDIQLPPRQTGTCLRQWHYSPVAHDYDMYKSAKQVTKGRGLV